MISMPDEPIDRDTCSLKVFLGALGVLAVKKVFSEIQRFFFARGCAES